MGPGDSVTWHSFRKGRVSRWSGTSAEEGSGHHATTTHLHEPSSPAARAQRGTENLCNSQRFNDGGQNHTRSLHGELIHEQPCRHRTCVQHPTIPHTKPSLCATLQTCDRVDRTPESMLMPPRGGTHLQGQKDEELYAAARLVNLTCSDHISRHQNKVSLQNLMATVQGKSPWSAEPRGAHRNVPTHLPRRAMASCLDASAMRLATGRVP